MCFDLDLQHYLTRLSCICYNVELMRVQHFTRTRYNCIACPTSTAVSSYGTVSIKSVVYDTNERACLPTNIKKLFATEQKRLQQDPTPLKPSAPIAMTPMTKMCMLSLARASGRTGSYFFPLFSWADL